MNFLIIGDPLDKLKPATDSSLAMTREALSRQHDVHWAEIRDFCYWDGRVMVKTQKFLECAESGLPRMEQGYSDPEPINSFDGIWIRKDPPFDQNYLSLCWLLSLEENNIPFINRPSLLLRYHEKMLPLEALERGYLVSGEVIPTFIAFGPRFKVPQDFPRGESIHKPWLGHGGIGVEKISSPQTPNPFTILQPFQKEIEKTGDRRIFILDGNIIGSFTRIPAPGQVKANIAAGGTGVLRDMNKKEQALANKIAVFTKDLGIAFAGVDMINEKISEINITSPTGFLSYRGIGGPRLEKFYLDYAESLL